MKKLTFILALFSLFCCASYAQKLSRSLDANGYELQNANLETWDDLPSLESGDTGRIGYYVSGTKIYFWTGTAWKKIVNELDSPTFTTVTAGTANAENSNVTGSLVVGGGSAASGYELTTNGDVYASGDLKIAGKIGMGTDPDMYGLKISESNPGIYLYDTSLPGDYYGIFSNYSAGQLAFTIYNLTDSRSELDFDGSGYGYFDNGLVVGGGNALGTLTVSEGDSRATAGAGTDTIVAENDGPAGVEVLTPNDETGYFSFGDCNDTFVGGMFYEHATDTLNLYAGNVTIFEGSPTSSRFNQNLLAPAFVVISSVFGDPDAPYPAKNVLVDGNWIVEKKEIELWVQKEIALGHVNLKYHWRWDERYALWLQTKDLTAEVRIVPVTKTIPRRSIAKENAFETYTTEEVVTEQKIPVIKSTKIQYVLKGDKVVQQERPIYKTQPVKKKRLKEGVQFDESDGTFCIPAHEIESGAKEIVIKSKAELETEVIRALDCNHQFFEKIHHSPIAELVDKDFQYAPNGYVEGYDRNELQDYHIEQQQKEIAALKLAMEKLIGK